jgi:hypothetical protein
MQTLSESQQHPSEGHGFSRLTFLLTIGLVCGWGVFQVTRLSFNVPWMDEAVYTVGGLDHEWFKWIGGLIYPPVAGLGAWGAMFLGLEPFVGPRFMSVLFGMGTAILIDRIAGLLAPFLTRDRRSAGWLPPMAVLLFSLSGSLLFIGRYAAYDGMCYFFVALSFYSFLRGILRKEPLALNVAALAVVASFATKYITAIYGMFPLPAVLFLTMQVVYKRRGKDDTLWGDGDARRLVKHFVLPLVLLGGMFLLLFWDFVQEGRSQVLYGVLPFGFQAGASEILVTSVKILLPVLPLAMIGVFVSRSKQVAALLATLAMVPVIYHLYFGHVASIGKVLALSYIPSLLLLAAAPLAWLAARIASARRWERLGLTALLAVVVVSTSFHAAAFLNRYQGWRNTRRSFESMRSFVRPTDRVLSYHIKFTAALMLRLPLNQVDERWDGDHLNRVRRGA